MTNRAATAISFLSFLGLAGCAAVDGGGAPPSGDPAATAESTKTALAASPLPEIYAGSELRGDASSLLSWQNPGFRRRFMESYVAETDIEPAVTAEERDVLLRAFDHVAKDELGAAAELVAANINAASSAALDYTLANIRFQQERMVDAAAAYRQAVEKHDKFRRAWSMLGEIHYRHEDYPNAARALTKVVTLGGGDAVTYGVLGDCHFRLEHYLAAESAFRQAAMLAPDTLAWQMGLAKSFFKQGRFAESVALFDRLLADNPERADLWLLQGEAYVMLGKPLDAVEDFEMVDELGGSTPASLNNLGDIYATQGICEAAADAYLRAIAKDPAGSPKRALRAAGHMASTGELAQARRLLDGIEQMMGERLDLATRKEILKLGVRVAVAEGAEEREAKALEDLIDLDPTDGDALILLGQHAARHDDPDQAMVYFERAANLDQHEAEAKLRHGELLVKLGRYPEALVLLRRSLELRPRDNVREFIDRVSQASRGR